MSQNPRNGRMSLLAAGLLLALLAFPTEAFAASTWTVAYKSGQSVMGEISTITWTVTNSASSTTYLNEVDLQLVNADYDINNGIAPPGWSVAAVDRQNRVITYTATGTCPSLGLAPGASADFSISVVGTPALSDQLAEAFYTKGNKTFAKDTCSNTNFATMTLTSAGWTRIGVGASIAVSPRTLSLLGTVSIDLTLTNRSSANGSQTLSPTVSTPVITNVTNPASPYADSTAFDLPVGPSPTSVSLAVNQTALINWTMRARKQGVFTFSVGGKNANISSPTMTTLTVAVGQFPGSLVISPTQAVDGQTVNVSLIVSNNDSNGNSYTSVSPNPPTFSGTFGATATLLTGPTPASVASIVPGNSSNFTWTYRVNGVAGATYGFTGQATATRNGSPIATDPVGSAIGTIVTQSMTINPNMLSGSTATTITYTIINGGSQAINKIQLLKPDATYFTLAASPFVSDTNTGWTYASNNAGPVYSTTTNPIAANGGTKTFTISYSTIGTVASTTLFSHRMALTQATDLTNVRVDAPVTIFKTRTVSLLSGVTALATNANVVVAWTNPSADHDGVVVLRSTSAAVTGVPVQGYKYLAGATLGNATVVYSDSASYVSTYTDTSVTNNSTYWYKVFNHDDVYRYSVTDVPSNAGVFAVPRVSPPNWAYSVGYQSLQQPFVIGGSAVYTSSNAATFTANNPLTGAERWRPVKLTAAIQARPTVATVTGLSGPHIFIGDHLGNVATINATTGQLDLLWGGVPRGTANGTGYGNGGGSIGDSVNAQAGLQLTAYEDAATTWGAAFRAKYPGEDLIYFSTYNASSTSNKVWALSSLDGFQEFTYSPGDLDIINGGVMVDYTHNHLWIPSRSNGGAQDSLRVIDVLNPGLGKLIGFKLGDIDNPVVRVGNEAYVVTNTGTLYGYELDNMTQVFTLALGKAVSSPLVPTATGFIVSTATGIQRFKIDSTVTPHTLTRMWPSSAPITELAYTAPTSARIDFTAGYVYFGDASGVIHQVNLVTGVEDKSLTLSGQPLGMPALDVSTTPHRLMVGSKDGRIFSVDLPL